MDRTVDPVSTALECFAGSLLDKLVDKPRCHGWEMVVERSSAGLPKPGWIATQPGALPFTLAFTPPFHHLRRRRRRQPALTRTPPLPAPLPP